MTPISPDPTIIPFELIELGRLKQPPGSNPRLVSTPFSQRKAGETNPPRYEQGSDVSASPATTPLLLIIAGADPLTKLWGPPRVPKSMSLYPVCCAASGTGIVSAANNVIAIAKINVLDFIRSPLLRLLAAGSVSQSGKFTLSLNYSSASLSSASLGVDERARIHWNAWDFD